MSVGVRGLACVLRECEPAQPRPGWLGQVFVDAAAAAKAAYDAQVAQLAAQGITIAKRKVKAPVVAHPGEISTELAFPLGACHGWQH